MIIVKSKEPKVVNFAVITNNTLDVEVDGKKTKSVGCDIKMKMCKEFDAFLIDNPTSSVYYSDKDATTFSVVGRKTNDLDFYVNFKIVEQNGQMAMLYESIIPKKRSKK